MPCVFLTGWCKDGDPIKTCIKLIQDECGRRIDYHSFFDIENNIVFIIDEAQESYADQTFWLSILKTQSGFRQGPRFCLFSSYGSPSTGLSALGMVSTPLRLAPMQRVSLMQSRQSFSPDIGLFYTKDEFDDVIKRWISSPGYSSFSLHGDASAYLFSITNGHPGAVAGLLSYIYEVITSGQIIGSLLTDHGRLIAMISNTVIPTNLTSPMLYKLWKTTRRSSNTSLTRSLPSPDPFLTAGI